MLLVGSVAGETGTVGTSRIPRFALPLQVAAVCFRRADAGVEFLLVRTNGGAKWTFPKGDPERDLSHSQAAEQEAWEEAGVKGTIERDHFHLYIHSKGVFWKTPGVQEYVVKAFLLEVAHTRGEAEPKRDPTWFSFEEARKTLARGREVKYAREMQKVIDLALQRIGRERAVGARG